jgi:hypothetical protein
LLDLSILNPNKSADLSEDRHPIRTDAADLKETCYIFLSDAASPGPFSAVMSCRRVAQELRRGDIENKL